jgi:hypothetical protein
LGLSFIDNKDGDESGGASQTSIQEHENLISKEMHWNLHRSVQQAPCRLTEQPA